MLGERFKMTSRCLGERRAAAAVEFALIVPVIAACIIGVINYGLAMFEKMELEGAARAGAQLALASTSDTAAIKSAVVGSTNLSITTADVTTTEFCECADGSTVTCGNTCSDGSANRYYFTVTVSEDYALLLVPTTITLTASATVRTQ